MKYTLTYTLVAKTVTEKIILMDSFKPSSEDMPQTLQRNQMNANDGVRITVEISPQ